MEFNNCYDQKKMMDYGIDIVDTYILDYIIYMYASDITLSVIINDKKYINLSKEMISNSLPILNLKERGAENRIRKLIENGFLEREQKFVDKKKKSFIKPTDLCLFIKTNYESYETFLKDNCNSKVNKKQVDKGKIVTRHYYKDCKHVKFSVEELEKLKEEFPLDFEKQIMNCENYCESKGKNYHNYLQTIRNWNRKKKTKNNSIDWNGVDF